MTTWWTRGGPTRAPAAPGGHRRCFPSLHHSHGEPGREADWRARFPEDAAQHAGPAPEPRGRTRARQTGAPMISSELEDACPGGGPANRVWERGRPCGKVNEEPRIHSGVAGTLQGGETGDRGRVAGAWLRQVSAGERDAGAAGGQGARCRAASRAAPTPVPEPHLHRIIPGTPSATGNPPTRRTSVESGRRRAAGPAPRDRSPSSRNTVPGRAAPRAHRWAPRGRPEPPRRPRGPAGRQPRWARPRLSSCCVTGALPAFCGDCRDLGVPQALRRFEYGLVLLRARHPSRTHKGFLSSKQTRRVNCAPGYEHHTADSRSQEAVYKSL